MSLDMEVVHGDCQLELPNFSDGYFDAVVTDPPYALGYMNKAWDKTGIAFDPSLWREVLRTLQPGAHLLAFGGTRTYHRLVCAIEDAGFEIRDSLHWIFGTGYPKSLNLEKGRGTALKPAHEPIVLARKPPEGTMKGNLKKHRGAGALNIDACRVKSAASMKLGRWPANVLFDEDAAVELDAQTSKLCSGGVLKGDEGGKRNIVSPLDLGPRGPWQSYGDKGGASRFFYVAKPGRKERDLGCEHLPAKTGGEVTNRKDGSAGTRTPRAGAGRTGGAHMTHPCVKPVALMQYLVRLITPPGGVVLDPFAGSGTTGVACHREARGFIGMELEAEYVAFANARIKAA